jgi:hypothetical protein
LIVAAVAAVLLATGLYGARAGWFAGDEDAADFVPQTVSVPAPERPVSTIRDEAVARADWAAPSGAPVVGVGGAVAADAPQQATLPVANGRADVHIRVPRNKADGTAYNGFSLEVRAGERRLWGTYLPAQAAKDRNDVVAVSFNAALLHSLGADAEPLTVVVGGTAMRKGDTLGIVRLTIQQTP